VPPRQSPLRRPWKNACPLPWTVLSFLDPRGSGRHQWRDSERTWSWNCYWDLRSNCCWCCCWCWCWHGEGGKRSYQGGIYGSQGRWLQSQSQGTHGGSCSGGRGEFCAEGCRACGMAGRTLPLPLPLPRAPGCGPAGGGASAAPQAPELKSPAAMAWPPASTGVPSRSLVNVTSDLASLLRKKWDLRMSGRSCGTETHSPEQNRLGTSLLGPDLLCVKREGGKCLTSELEIKLPSPPRGSSPSARIHWRRREPPASHLAPLPLVGPLITRCCAALQRVCAWDCRKRISLLRDQNQIPR